MNKAIHKGLVEVYTDSGKFIDSHGCVDGVAYDVLIVKTVDGEELRHKFNFYESRGVEALEARIKRRGSINPAHWRPLTESEAKDREAFYADRDRWDGDFDMIERSRERWMEEGRPNAYSLNDADEERLYHPLNH
jgi:hypothetical protein